MTNELYRSSISLRLTSFIIPADFMISTVGMTPLFAWNKGESRLLPYGKELNSVKENSYASFRLFENDDRWLPEMLSESVERLRIHRNFFHQLKNDEGGRAEFFIGWFLSRSGGDTLPSSLLLEVANLGLDLSFDIYPGEDTEEP
ncbi:MULTISPECIES: hypothetical protein [unclassified Luteibacter]|uniref:hypothetical protein n=1 Tax=Luteibacter sp. PvP019 TaxID=3156436 RepID=UPI003396EBBB